MDEPMIDRIDAMLTRLAGTSSDPRWITDELTALKVEAAGAVSAQARTTNVRLNASSITTRNAFAMALVRQFMANDPTAMNGDSAAIRAIMKRAYMAADIQIEVMAEE